MPLLEAVDLTKRYQHAVALDGLRLSIEPGEIFCLLGQNGAGKTTTINLFLGFIEASSGKALVHGKEVHPKDSTFRKHLAYIPEVVQLYGNLSGLENLDFFSRLAGYRYDRSALSAWLTRSGLSPDAQDRRLSGYSKGMRQKVGIAIALAKHADIILMDEPTSGLDPKASAEFAGTCRALAGEGKSVLMATHDLFNAVHTGTRIGIMKQGRLVHTLGTQDIDASALQQLYLQTI